MSRRPEAHQCISDVGNGSDCVKEYYEKAYRRPFYFVQAWKTVAR